MLSLFLSLISQKDEQGESDWHEFLKVRLDEEARELGSKLSLWTVAKLPLPPPPFPGTLLHLQNPNLGNPIKLQKPQSY